MCPGCLIALAGFGDDAATGAQPVTPPSPIQLPAEAAQNLGTGIIALFAGPAIGSVLAAAIGAIAWKQHRAWGGIIGFLLGGALGGVIGSIVAKGKITAALPDLQNTIDQALSLPPGTSDPFTPPPGGWSVGPLDVPGLSLAAPMLPSLKALFPRPAQIISSDAITNLTVGKTMAAAAIPDQASPQALTTAVSSEGVKKLSAGMSMKDTAAQQASAAPIAGRVTALAQPVVKCPAGMSLMGGRCIANPPAVTTKQLIAFPSSGEGGVPMVKSTLPVAGSVRKLPVATVPMPAAAVGTPVAGKKAPLSMKGW